MPTPSLALLAMSSVMIIKGIFIAATGGASMYKLGSNTPNGYVLIQAKCYLQLYVT
jgi:predicted flavoprotein YhiN